MDKQRMFAEALRVLANRIESGTVELVQFNVTTDRNPISVTSEGQMFEFVDEITISVKHSAIFGNLND